MASKFHTGQHLNYKEGGYSYTVEVARIIPEKDGENTIVMDIAYLSNGKWCNVGHRHSRKESELIKFVERYEEDRKKSTK